VTCRATRFSAAVDLAIVVGVTLICGFNIPAISSVLKRLGGIREGLALALFQFIAEGLAVLVLLAVRRERLSDYGFAMHRLYNSLAIALVFTVANDAALSWHRAELVWVPLRRHLALRLSLAAQFPLNVIGLAATVAAWGFFEAFYGVFFANRLNRILARSGHGWLSPGALGFGVFNGLIHAGIGQGVYGFITSFASGYAIAVIPAITSNSWGSVLFQTLTNSVGRL
jgi:hypothetical protein